MNDERAYFSYITTTNIFEYLITLRSPDEYLISKILVVAMKEGIVFF